MDTATAQTSNNDSHAPGSALARIAPAAPSPYDPRNLEELRGFSKDMAASKLTKVRSAEQAMLIIVTGHELGMPPAAALRMIYVADFGNGDQATISADGMVAVCLSHPEVCEYFRCVERSDVSVTYATKRRGSPEERETFTQADKERAKLGVVGAGKDASLTNWAKYPAVMLGHRAASILARRVYPDLLGGMYTDDEAREIADNTREVAPAVSPLTAAASKAVEIRDAEVVESDEARIVRLMSEAETNERAQELAQEAKKIWPTERPGAVKEAFKAAQARLAAKATEKVAAAMERTPGEEG